MLKEVGPHYTAALKYVTDFSLAVDGGAHRGHWTRKMLENFKEVVAFEPLHSHFAALPGASRNINGALGDVGEGSRGLCPGPDNDGQYHLNGCGDTAVYSLDQFKLESCGFLKLDVEGYEFFALRGARETIENYRPVIVVELNGLGMRYGVEDEKVENYVKSFRYELAEKKNKDYIFAPL